MIRLLRKRIKLTDVRFTVVLKPAKIRISMAVRTGGWSTSSPNSSGALSNTNVSTYLPTRATYMP